MEKSERREQQRQKERMAPRGNPKFLHLLMQEELKRLQERIRKVRPDAK